MIYCYGCEQYYNEPAEIFEQTGVSKDGISEQYITECCPVCGSKEIEAAWNCDLCGNGVTDRCNNYAGYFCDDCIREIKTALYDFARRIENENHVEIDVAIDVISGIADEMYEEVCKKNEWI